VEATTIVHNFVLLLQWRHKQAGWRQSIVLIDSIRINC
jgi:hypothetical protein